MRWTRAECVAAVQAAARDVDGPLTQAAYRRWCKGGVGPADSTIRDRVGDWPDALAAAGLAVRIQPGQLAPRCHTPSS